MRHATLAGAIALALGFTAVPARAQDGSGAAAAKALDTVTVTARRREESLQQVPVPVAVSAFDADTLRDLQADNVAGLQGAVPNVNIVQGRGSASSANVFIRGIGQPDALPTFDPGVGMYVDDVYYARIQGALFNLFDIERIEVLRGPQGTLYGKNSTGGAIKLVTRAPEQDLHGIGEISVGDHGRREARGYLTGALGPVLSASVAAIAADNDGAVRGSDGRHYNDDGADAVRAKLALRPDAAFAATVSADYTRQHTAPTLGLPRAPLYQTELSTGARTTVLLPPAASNDRAETSLPPGSGQRLTQQGVAATLEFGRGAPWLIKSISAYRDMDTTQAIDIDGSALVLGDTLARLRQHQLSQELQWQYDDGGALRVVSGLYYLREGFRGGQDVRSDDVLTYFGMPVPYLTSSDERQTTTSSAAFGQLSWDLRDDWTVTGGLRYSRDRKDYARASVTRTGLPPLDSAFAFDASRSWSAWTPSLSLNHDFNARVMGYVSASRGFKSGGFNGRASRASETRAFDPEYVWTYELGLKSESRNGRLRGNVTVFHSDYRDFQARVADVADPAAPTPTFVFPVLNAAEVAIDGVELEGTALVGEGTKLSAQLGWMDARYKRFDDPRVALDPSLAQLHAHVPFSPDWNAQLSASQVFRLAGGASVTVGGDLSWRSETWLSVDNRAALRQGGYALVGVFASWDSADYRWQLRAGVRNLTDRVYMTDAQEFSSVANVQTGYFGWPRSWTLSARYSF